MQKGSPPVSRLVGIEIIGGNAFETQQRSNPKIFSFYNFQNFYHVQIINCSIVFIFGLIV